MNVSYAFKILYNKNDIFLYSINILFDYYLRNNNYRIFKKKKKKNKIWKKKKKKKKKIKK